MKKLLLLTVGFLLISLISFGQAASSYAFTALSGSYIPLTGVPGVVDTSLGATATDGVSTSIALPFALTFAGTAYSNITVSPNGWLSFGSPTVTNVQNKTNTLANAGVAKPMLFPLWDDLACSVKPRYITTGIYPHRRFKVEWSQQKWNSTASGDVISFQIWFFETTNVIEFLYSQGATAVANTSGGASIGICDANGKYLTLSNSGASPTADYNSFTTDISTKPATGQIYRFTPPPTSGLEVSKYCFTAASVPYKILAGATDVSGIAATQDDGLSNAITLQFPFTYGGNVYSDLKVSSNGWLTFGNGAVTQAQDYNNSLTNAGVAAPILMPLWDDLRCTVKPRYITAGVAPNRIFKLEWFKQKWNYQASADVISFQIWLYEGSNTIEYYYNQNATAINLGSATIGIYDANDNYLTLSNSGTSPAAQSSTFTTNIATKPASGQMYRFTPPPIIAYPGNAYIAIGKVGVTQTGAAGGTYSATPTGLSLNSATGEVNLATSAGGTYTVVYTVAGCATSTAVMTIFPLLPVPTATVTPATCTTANDGAITITNMNNAINFVKTDNDYIDLGSPLLSNRSAFTIEGWIKFNIADVVGRVSLFGQNDAIEFGFLNSTTIELWTPAAGSVTAALPASLGDGAWHHIAAVGNGSTVKIYLNGASVPVTGGVVTTSNYGSSAYSAKIGSGVYAATGDSFTGQVLKLGLYSRAFSPIEITYVAIGPTTYSGFETGIIAGYNFLVGSGTTVYSLPAGNNGTFNNTPEWIDPYTYNWQKIGGGFTATTKNLINLLPGNYGVNVSLVGVTSPNGAMFNVGSASLVTAVSASGANCSNSFTANWTTSSGAVSYTIDVSTDPEFATFVGAYNNFNVGNVITYSLTGLPAGTIYYRVYKNSSCGKSNASNVISYATLQIKSPTAIDATSLLCNGFTANWNAVSGATGYYLDISTDVAFGSFVTGYNNLNVGNVTTLVVTPLASGVTYYYRVRSYNATCGTVATPSNVIPVLINTGPTAPVVGLIKQITCAMPGGSVVLSGLPAGSWTLTFSSGESYAGTGTTITITDLLPGNYTTAVSAGFCFSSNSTPIVINASTISPTTWDGTTWSNGAPTSLKRVVFDGGAGNVFPINYTLNMCSCEINSGSVVVSSGVVMVVEDFMNISALASVTFENNASLVQINDAAVNEGSIVYKRITTPMKNFDFTYWSSPVVGQSLYDLSPNTFYDKYWSFSNDKWVSENSSNLMSPPGRGYAIRTPKAGTWGNGEVVTFPYLQAVAFKGIPNNGVVSLPIQAIGSYNLIGNPYPSALNGIAFLNENSVNNARLGGSMYLWTHNTAITNNAYGGIADYAIYNGSGGLAATSGGAIPSGNIASGQSFFIISTGTEPAVFNNSMRVGAVSSNGQFFKGKNAKVAESEKHRIWLELTNADGLFKQVLVGYIAGATNEVDVAFDAESFNSNKYIDFYSVNGSNNLSIQGRKLPFSSQDRVPLGYRTTVEGTFEIKIANVDGALLNQTIFIEDKETGIIHNLKNGSYSFITTKGTFNDRFMLVYVDKNAVVVPPVIEIPAVVEVPVVDTPATAETPVEGTPIVDTTAVLETPVIVTSPAVETPIIVESPVIIKTTVIETPVVETTTVQVFDPTLGSKELGNKQNGVVVSVLYQQIKVNSFDETIDAIYVYDLRGRKLYEKVGVDNSEFIIQNLEAAHEVLLIKTLLKNGQLSVKQIIF